MTRARLGGVLLLLLSSGIFISWGASLERSMPHRMIDFNAVYYGTRCLLQHRDPYSQSELQTVYLAEERDRDPELSQLYGIITICVNLPTAFIFIAPFAMLPWLPAHVLWMTVTAASLMIASFLMWSLGAKRAPGVSIFLACMVLANCEYIFAAGNTAGIVVSLCVVGAWCFLEDRLAALGVICLAISLAIKPQDVGFVWLYFLLAGGVYRKRALQTLAVTLVLGLAAVLWISSVAPHWAQELHSNLVVTTAHGGLNDPELNRFGSRDPDPVIDMQTVIGAFRDNPQIYNPVTYLICGPLLLVWILVTLRSRSSSASAGLALAAIAALSLLPVYHRHHDAKLLLLTIPACALLWAEGGPIRWLALLVNTAAVVLTGDIPLAILEIFTKDLHLGTMGLPGSILTVAVTRPIPPILFAMGVFYLWVYLRRMPTPARFTDARSPEQQRHEPVPLVSDTRQNRAPSSQLPHSNAVPHGKRG